MKFDRKAQQFKEGDRLIASIEGTDITPEMSVLTFRLYNMSMTEFYGKLESLSGNDYYKKVHDLLVEQNKMLTKMLKKAGV